MRQYPDKKEHDGLEVECRRFSDVAGGVDWGIRIPTKELPIHLNVYEAIGVVPFINCKGTFTILTGSQSLPEVKQAMEAASRSYVHMDELMEAVGARLAQITGAEWGIVTAGCAAAMTHTTAACIVGSDPRRCSRSRCCLDSRTR